MAGLEAAGEYALYQLPANLALQHDFRLRIDLQAESVFCALLHRNPVFKVSAF